MVVGRPELAGTKNISAQAGAGARAELGNIVHWINFLQSEQNYSTTKLRVKLLHFREQIIAYHLTNYSSLAPF